MFAHGPDDGSSSRWDVCHRSFCLASRPYHQTPATVVGGRRSSRANHFDANRPFGTVRCYRRIDTVTWLRIES